MGHHHVSQVFDGLQVVETEDGPDVFVPADRLRSAVDGDRVVARGERRRRGDRPEGRVIKVLERARTTVVGVYHPARTFGFVVPEDRKLGKDVFIPPGQEAGAEDGDVVVVAITKGRLDFGPWEQIFYGEFDGRRPKRIMVKIIGK